MHGYLYAGKLKSRRWRDGTRHLALTGASAIASEHDSMLLKN